MRGLNFDIERAIEFIKEMEKEDGPRDWVIQNGKVAVEFTTYDPDFGIQSSFALMPSDPEKWEAWWEMMVKWEEQTLSA